MMVACVLLSVTGLDLFGQFRINTNSTVVGKGTISTNTSITNNATNTDLTLTEVFLSGTNQQATTTQPLIVGTLSINNGGIKDLTGNWEVTSALELTDGILRVGSGSKLVYSGTTNLSGSAQSYVDGFLFLNNTATDRRFVYPVGISGNFLPVTLETAPAGELGIRVVAGDAGLALPAEISDYLRTWYWEATAAPNSVVSLSLNQSDAFLDGAAPVVLSADGTGAAATALGGTVVSGDVSSNAPSTQPVLALGKGVEFLLVIHDMITPYILDDKNDRLIIDNIELTESNHVRLLDRYGVVVKEWFDYTNDNQEDFTTLSPGNYVCIVDFTYPGSESRATAKGVVTILKSN